MVSWSWFPYLATALVWIASAILIVHSFMLADEIADRFRPKGGNYKHDNRPHKARLRFFGVRNFAILIFAVILPAFILGLSLVRPYLFFLVQGPVLLSGTDGSPASAWGVSFFVINETLQGVAGDFLEVFEIRFSDAVIINTGISRFVSGYRLMMSIFGATAFFSFCYVVIDRLLIKVRLWKNSRNIAVRVNLSGLSRGYIVNELSSGDEDLHE